MTRSGRNNRPDKNVKGNYGFTSMPSGGKGGGAGKDRSGGRAGEIFAPPSMKGPAGSPYGIVSKANNDGNLATRQSPNMRPRAKSLCFISTACVETRGRTDDCYELRLLRLFRAEYVARLPEGARVLREYEDKAPLIVRAIQEMPYEDAARVWAEIYDRGVARAVSLITNGRWDEAYELYTSMCLELENRFVPADRGPAQPLPPNPGDAA